MIVSLPPHAVQFRKGCLKHNIMSQNVAKRRFKLNPYLRVTLGFLTVIVAGALLLMLPFSTADGKGISVPDAFFTAVSAVCVTGLSTVEAGTVFTFWGQLILLLLIQIGGLGFMTVAALMFLALGKRLGISDRIALQESMNKFELDGVVQMTKRALQITAVTEGAGALLLLYPMISRYGFAKGLWTSIFHSVSAFCNAGFDIFGRGDSLAGFYDDPYVLAVTMLLIIVGGLGFLVLLDIKRCLRKRGRLMLQSRIVLIVSAALIAAGAVLFTAAEWDNHGTIGSFTPGQKIMCGLFQSVSARTAGFAVFSQGSMQSVSYMLTMLFMFIGASPAGTGGGVKTTTFALLIILMLQIVRGRRETVVFKRKINSATVLKAIGITSLSIIFILLCTFAVSAVEANTASGGELAFEVVSAFGTVGFSQGITPLLSTAGKFIIMLIMFAGRVGLMSVITALSAQFEKNGNKGNISYPEEKLMIG